MAGPDRISQTLARVEQALAARLPLCQEDHENAFRVFNGFCEGDPSLLVDIYARTLLLQNYADQPAVNEPLLTAVQRLILAQLPWLDCVVVKTRKAASRQEQLGVVTHGTTPAGQVREHGVWYALNLTLNRDASFFLDTRGLRRWALDHLAGKSVLNTFAYTGSLGVAAAAGRAKRVLHLDQSREYLQIARQSYRLNHLAIRKEDFASGDFWEETSKLRRAKMEFDCVFLDPPFFTTSGRGQIDLASDYQRLLNKVRPLVADNGWLVAVNNALFLPGKKYLRVLEKAGEDGYLAVDQILPVPEDIIGYAKSSEPSWPADPQPFNHPTKIAILKVRKKSIRAA